ncbi:heme peroxidase [Pelagophyceae sp. CCMP2097]|nr:heme peroxidase [Pelagophyceae sp. CCMP2097]
MALKAVLAALAAQRASAACPYASASGAMPAGHEVVWERPPPTEGYQAAVEALDVAAVKVDIRAFLVKEQAMWGADFGNYGPFMIRLAWHCAGTYRKSDGLGGCDGARQRFDHERSWDDNANLDKARQLLQPLKVKYGLGLSWGDLITLAGTVAIESMGGPVLGYCLGRVDESSGYWAEELGPSALQQEVAPCAPGEIACEAPFGATALSQIYVNPGGPGGASADFLGAAAASRSSFLRMGMNDSETVALIGGGHAFGKGHGACPAGNGPGPAEQPLDAWPGLCGEGSKNVADRFTSGWEATWSEAPTTWTNLYFQYLADFDFSVNPIQNTAGNIVYWNAAPGSPDLKMTPKADGTGTHPIAFYTSDVAMQKDAAYAAIVGVYAEDLGALDRAFSNAWYKLQTRDMGPISRCAAGVGDTPPAQDWQFPLPATPAVLADFDAVALDIAAVGADDAMGAQFVRLALSCASTFRVTDYRGGCNGARILQSPEKDWDINAGLDTVVAALEPIKAKYGDGLSWADLIVLAGNVGLMAHGSGDVPFCGGRTDAADGLGSADLYPRVTGAFGDRLPDLKHLIKISGLTIPEHVALTGLNEIGQMHATLTTGTGAASAAVSNHYFKALLSETWTAGEAQYTSGSRFSLMTDIFIKFDDELQAAASALAGSESEYKKTLVTAWTKLMTADRFDGPQGNVCAAKNAALVDGCCKDSASWYKKGDPSKDCAWVKEYAVKRCLVKGFDNSDASEHCLCACE